MKTTGFASLPTAARLYLAGLLLIPLAVHAADEEELGGWQQKHIERPDSWQELDAALPPYPEEKNLLDLKIGTDGMQYSVMLDKQSLVRGEDGVVRYTVVLVAPSGPWNVSNEGLRCGEKVFRRYAYGFEGQWQPLANAPWQPVRDGGANRYRRILYFDYFCHPMRSGQTVQQMIDSFSESFHEM